MVCVSPLVSLMMDQVRKYSAQGLATQFVGEAQEDWSVTARVLDGENQLLYLSPEALLRASYGRRCCVLPSIEITSYGPP